MLDRLERFLRWLVTPRTPDLAVRQSEWVLLVARMEDLEARFVELRSFTDALIMSRWHDPERYEVPASVPPSDDARSLAGLAARLGKDPDWLVAHAGELWDGALLADLDSGGSIGADEDPAFYGQEGQS